MPDEMPADSILLAAAKRASANAIFEDGIKREARLVQALCEAMMKDRSLDVPRTECRFPLSNWTRAPGGVDLSVRARDGKTSLLVETKVGKPEEAIWDIIKLADICVLDKSVTDVYLAYAADKKAWAKADKRTALLAAVDRSWDVRGMIEHNEGSESDWRWLLKGGKGIRPEISISRVRLTRVGTCAMADLDHELRLIKVRPVGRGKQHFDDEGHPTSLAKPQGVRRADEGTS